MWACSATVLPDAGPACRAPTRDAAPLATFAASGPAVTVGAESAPPVERPATFEVDDPWIAPTADCASRRLDRKSTRLNSSHVEISYAVFCLKKKKTADSACDVR